MGTVPARGVAKGVIVDIDEAAASIQESIQAASHMAGFPVRKVLAGVTGSYIDSCNLKGGVSLTPAPNENFATVTEHDIFRVFESAVIRVSSEREFLHLIPRSFSLDGQAGVDEPLGMNASRLEADIHLVTAAAGPLRNVIECINKVGIEIQALVLESIATSHTVSTADERKNGVVIIDIGGGTCDISVFCDGTLHTSQVVAVGGNHVTRDISIGLHTPFDIAERLKIESGSVASALSHVDETLEVYSAETNERVRMPRATLEDIIAPRMTELFEMTRNVMYSRDTRDQMPASIIITGGGALLPGATDLAQQVFGMPVSLRNPSGLTGWADRVSSPKFSTAVGLLHYARRLQKNGYAFAQLSGNDDSVRRIWGVPLEFDSPPEHSDAKSSENLFFDSPTKPAIDSAVEAETTPSSIVPEAPKKWRRVFDKFIQPAVDRLRVLLGFDVE